MAKCTSNVAANFYRLDDMNAKIPKNLRLFTWCCACPHCERKDFVDRFHHGPFKTKRLAEQDWRRFVNAQQFASNLRNLTYLPPHERIKLVTQNDEQPEGAGR